MPEELDPLDPETEAILEGALEVLIKQGLIK